MKTMLNPRRRHYLARVSTFLIAVVLIAGTVGCGGSGGLVEYDLTITSSAGGSVTTPGEGTFTYGEGAVVNLVATPDAIPEVPLHYFVNWTGDVDTVADAEDATTTITMNGDYSIVANFALYDIVEICDLTISSTEGGSVTTPGEGVFAYGGGTVVDLVAEAEEGYQFVNWTGDAGTVTDVGAASTTITITGDYTITASFAKEIRNWHGLDAIRDNPGGSYVLMNDLDSTTAGYTELASPTANQGKGWQPIGTSTERFIGSLDGQRYEVRDLFIDRPDESGVGLVGYVGVGGAIDNVGVVNAELTGYDYVGGLVGRNDGTVSNCYSTGTVTGQWDVGGLVGGSWGGTVSDSYSTGSVTGEGTLGGLVGDNRGTVSNSYFTGSVTGEWGSVDGLVGYNYGTVSNSYYSYDEVLINGRNIITIGALSNDDFEQWLANDKFLDVNERLSQEDGYYLINDVNDFKSLLAFGQDGALKFRLKNDLDLGDEPNFYIPYLAGEFDGNGRKIANLSFSFDFISQVGLFGYLASGGKVSEVGAENVNITGHDYVGGLVGENAGTVSNSYSTGSVTGSHAVGGLVGLNHGTVSNSYSAGSVTGSHAVGGLVGWNTLDATVSNSYYSYDEVLINGKNIVTVGALFNEDFEHWLANDKFLDVNERLSQEDGYYLINDVNDFKSLLAFGQDGALKFRLTSDLDLGDEPNLYIPYLAGEFDGNGHKIANLSFSFDFISQVGLFGCLACGGEITQVGVENVNITGAFCVGGLVGENDGTMSNCYSSGSVTGDPNIGGLVGENWGTVSNCYSTGSVTGDRFIGGLVGGNMGTVSNCYSTGSMTGGWSVGGLVGENSGTLSNSFWDTETSGQAASDGGTGKTTAEMQDIATFTDTETEGLDEAWDITAVAPGVTNTAYAWNIVDGETYPFLSWQSVS